MEKKLKKLKKVPIEIIDDIDNIEQGGGGSNGPTPVIVKTWFEKNKISIITIGSIIGFILLMVLISML